MIDLIHPLLVIRWPKYNPPFLFEEALPKGPG
jgi:hypothetical protein